MLLSYKMNKKILFNHLLNIFSNVDLLLRKCQQSQYLLKKLNSFGVRKKILLVFYYSFIESIITVSIKSKITGLPVRNLLTQHDQKKQKTKNKLSSKNDSHPPFEWLPLQTPTPIVQQDTEEGHLFGGHS